MMAAASSWANANRVRAAEQAGPSVSAVLSQLETLQKSASEEKAGFGGSFKKSFSRRRNDEELSPAKELVSAPKGMSAGYVPNQKANVLQEKIDMYRATHLLNKAAETVGPHLTRQNTGAVASPLFEQLQSKRRKFRTTKTKAWWLIDPRTSKHIPKWDALMSLAIIFTALVTPFEVSFLPIATTASDALFLINRIIDVTFVIDMLVNFVLIYQESENGDSGIIWVDKPSRIVWHYLTSWFLLDFFSIAPSAIDVYMVSSGGSDGPEVGGGDTGSDIGGLRTLRTLRALRLIKMVRLVRTSGILKRWETKVAVDYTALELTKCLIAVLLCTHWFASLWTLQATIVSQSVLDSWLGNYEYCVAAQPASSSIGFDCPAGFVCSKDDPGVACMPPGALYGASIYWAIATIVSVGYGDIGATPYNTAEQVICGILILSSGVLWGWVIGTFCGTIANLAPGTRAFRENMDDLNRYCAANRVDHMLRRRLREYFHRTRHLHDAASDMRLLGMMSPMLQSEVVLAVNARWLRGVWFLENAEAEFVVRLTLQLTPMVLAPFELAPTGFLYILYRGVVIIDGELVVKGHTWGEDIILVDVAPRLCRNWNAKAMNYAEVFLCSHDTLYSTIKHFPSSKEHLRKCALRLAFRRNLIRAANDVIKLKKEAMASEGLDEQSASQRALSKLATSFRRAKTIRGMLAKSTVASEAQANLQAQLMTMRPNAALAELGTSAGTLLGPPGFPPGGIPAPSEASTRNEASVLHGASSSTKMAETSVLGRVNSVKWANQADRAPGKGNDTGKDTWKGAIGKKREVVASVFAPAASPPTAPSSNEPVAFAINRLVDRVEAIASDVGILKRAASGQLVPNGGSEESFSFTGPGTPGLSA